MHEEWGLAVQKQINQILHLIKAHWPINPIYIYIYMYICVCVCVCVFVFVCVCVICFRLPDRKNYRYLYLLSKKSEICIFCAI